MELDRRMFIKGGLLAGAGGALAATLGACAQQSGSGLGSSGGNSATASGTAGTASSGEAGGALASAQSKLWALDTIANPSQELKTELVIIGGGGTGLAAATQARQLGIDTIVLEKMGAPGGSFICTEGMFVFDSHWQKAAGVKGDYDTLLARLMDYHHWIPSPEFYRNFIMQTAETVDWCESIGCEYGVLATIGETPQSFLAWKHDAHGGGSPGSEFAASLAKAAEKAGAQMVLRSSGKKIELEGGKVVAVLAEDADGLVTRIKTQAVLIATGGYGQNEEMLKELAHFICRPVEPGTAGRVGDGMRLALDAGAALWDYPGTLPLLGPLVAGAGWEPNMVITSFQPLLWLNQNCERFIGEDTHQANFTYAGQAAKNQERALTLLTQKDLDYFEQTGPYVDIFTMGHVGTPVAGVKARLKELEQGGTVFVADTLDDVAAKAGLDATALKSLVNRYNGYCASGVDTEFNKAARFLVPVESGPYYLLENAVCFTGSGGCLKVDTHMRCLNAKREPVPGLYAGGCDAGGLFGDSYDPSIAGGSMASWAINSGRLAAKGIAKYLGK